MASTTKRLTATPATPLTYSAWRDAAAKDLAERHGLRINVREKAWREWYIKGMTPTEAADRAAADYDARRPLVDRTGRLNRLPKSAGSVDDMRPDEDMPVPSPGPATRTILVGTTKPPQSASRRNAPSVRR